MGTLSGGGGGGGGALGVPAFPLRARPSAPHCAPYSPSRFHIDKRCQHRCSWKCFSIAMILLAVVLAAMLTYFATLSSMKSNVDSSNCILVQDVKAVTHDQMTQDLMSTQSPTEESAATAAVDKAATTLSAPHLPQQQTQAQQHWPPTLELRDFNVRYSITVPPLQFWNSEFRNKQPAHVRFNFTVPWGGNFAVYGRRNVSPSITQFDFMRYVRGGRVDHTQKRRRRSTDEQDLEDSPSNESHSINRNADYRQTGGKTDVLNSILQSYDGTDRILSDGDRKGPFYVPPHDPIVMSPDNNDDKFSREFHAAEPRPTVDLQFTIDEHIIAKRAISESSMSNVSILHYLDTGRWFLSVYNDEPQPYDIELIVSEVEGNPCPNDCSGHGSCYLGKCDCIDGFQGDDCSKSVCPLLCSGHGQYGGGICHCEEGWKGPECDVPKEDCLPADCGGRGRCIEGACRCSKGWKGEGCDEPDCPDPECKGHGACVAGHCYCKAGWRGEDCSEVDHQVYQCLPGCSQHGTYDLDSGKCICDNHWTGVDCSQAACGLDCGAHGVCSQGKCQCEPSWNGTRCEQRACDDRCSAHGQCKNGTCVCSQGWNGKHCTLPGCENGCSRHGQCSLETGEYRCVCSKGWAGADCSIALEMECDDTIDNDRDGTADCYDTECCSQEACKESIMCVKSNEPADVLLRKQPPSVTASFYQRVKFLIEENSVQSYAHMDEYSESRVSVIRGQVLTPQGLGVVGIRVAVERDNRFGFTLTRQDGWFDVLVNGGGAVTLQFQRSPFQPLFRTVFVPWNQIVVLPPVYMLLSTENERTDIGLANQNGLGFPGLSSSIFSRGAEPCLAHDHELLSPKIAGTWAPHTVGGQPGRSLIFAETQIVQESIPIPGSDLYLMYQSSQAAGYLSTVHMKLTHDSIPPTLTHVHIRVEIEGSLHVKTYEADPNLTHTFAWNKRNVYKQKVYGVAQAKISIGYQHNNCKEPVWETQTATLQGCDVDISDIGGWGLDIHHHYNFHEGILQKGDGSTLHLKQYPRTVQVVMGTGLRRPLSCPDHCNGKAKDANLLTPVALTSGPDGSLYVGDFNLIRRITPEGMVHTVLQLSATQVSYQYYLCVSPADGHLYVSDPEKHQILRVLSLDAVDDPVINVEPVVGNGERCIPGDETKCGDEFPAIHAKLSHPKGLAIAADKTMYIADGTNIRAVDPKGIIHTIVGHHGHHNHWSPAPCTGAIPAHQAQLQWPTGLSLSPLDGSLHFIDDRLVLKLTPDMKVKVVAGTPLHCRSNANGDNEKCDDKTEPKNLTLPLESKVNNVLGTVLSLSFAPTGELYIAEADSRRANLIKCLDTAGKITLFAGKQQEKIKDFICECNSSSSTTSNPQSHGGSEQLPINCPCSSNMFVEEPTSNAETLLSSNAKFQTISALSVSPDGVLNVADQGSLHILALKHYLPSHDESGEFRIPYPPTSEIYVFNRYGQHVATKDLASAKTRYSFLYSKNTSFGKLSTVTDASGNKIQFLRDYSNLVSSIENTQDHKSELKMSGVGFLTKLTEKGRSEIELDYDSNSGLLNSKSGGGETFIYEYDDLGRVTTLIVPTGEVINIASELSKNNGLLVEISNPVKAIIVNDKQHKSELLMQGQNSKILSIKNEEEHIEAAIHSNDTLSVITPWGGKLESAALAKHPLLEAALPVEAEMLRMWSHQTTTFGDNMVNTMSSVYSLVGDVRNPQQTLNREIWVNNSKILAIEFDQFTSKETFYDRDHQPLLVITFDPAGLPQSFVPFGGAAPVNISYDRFNRIDGWKWGRSEEKYSYDRHGLLSEISCAGGGSKIISYNDWNLISKITLTSQRRFSFLYDDDGGLRHVTLPTGTKHSFSVQPSLGFLRVTYTPPGSSRSYLQHYSHSGALLQTVYPGDGARIVYRYHGSGRLAEIVHGDGRTEIRYSKPTGMPSEVLHSERDMDYRWEYQYTGGLLTEERIDFGAKTGLSNAKFTYEYDTNYRLTSIQGRIGGQLLPLLTLGYSSKTGALDQLGQFKISKPSPNEIKFSDGTALFTRTVNEQLLETQITLTIHRLEVFRMEFVYDNLGKILESQTFTRNMAVNMYVNVKNYTWDSDGQLVRVESQEPWGFKYDDNGNMLSLTYKGNIIPMEYNAMDRIVKFGDGQYRYDNRGSVVQNTREERFQYNTKGLLVRATKRGRFDVRYYYDHLDRLATRKDNFGNITQFFYNNQDRPHEVNQIYSPRDGKLMTLVYDDRGHLIFAQMYRHKYYFATDQCGTPNMIFNQYGEGIREIMRSPYGHIVYDSHPYMYLPIDFCGGLLDRVTALVHMPNGKVYDPLIGQYLSPVWENIVERIANPTQMHLYRINGNDPINLKLTRKKPTDHLSWLSRLGYNLKSLAPQLFPDDLPGGSVLPPITRQPTIWGSYKDAWSLQLPSLLSNLPAINVESGFVSFLSLRKMSDAKSLSAPPRSALKTNVMDLVPKKIGAASDPPFGKGILVSRNPHGQAIVSSVPAANAIYRDVYTSVFNRSSMLPFTFVVHSAQQDAFYFVKEETWRASEDKQQLKRMQGQVNTTFHEIPKENGSGNNYLDVKIHGSNAVINLRYGTTAEKEKQRLLHHARLTAVRKAWHREKEFVRNGFSGSIEWSTSEIDEIQKQGFASNYEGEYVHDIQTYPELAEDPFNIQFIKKQPDKSKRRRRKRQSKDREKSLPFDINEIESDC